MTAAVEHCSAVRAARSACSAIPVVNIPAGVFAHEDRLHARTVRGDCMEPALHDGDVIIIDPVLPAGDGDLVAAHATVNGICGLMVKRLHGNLLTPDNPAYEPVEMGPGTRLEGVVVGVWHPVR